MIPGITASENRVSSGGGGVYTASAVAFGGSTTLVNSSISSTDNNFVSFAGWFRPASADFSSTSVTFVVDPSGLYGTNMFFNRGTGQLVFYPEDNFELQYDNTHGNPALSAGSWYHVIGSFNSNFPYLYQMYVNDVQSTLLGSGDSSSFTCHANGLPFWVGGDGIGDPYFGSIADLSFWPGVSFLLESGDADIPLSIRRLFIDGSGAPVNPSVAIASLGTPAVMLSGGPLAFISNALGGSGSFTTTSGGLTSDSTTVHV